MTDFKSLLLRLVIFFVLTFLVSALVKFFLKDFLGKTSRNERNKIGGSIFIAMSIGLIVMALMIYNRFPGETSGIMFVLLGAVIGLSCGIYLLSTSGAEDRYRPESKVEGAVPSFESDVKGGLPNRRSFCSKCGERLIEEDTFCSSCGAQLS